MDTYGSIHYHERTGALAIFEKKLLYLFFKLFGNKQTLLVKNCMYLVVWSEGQDSGWEIMFPISDIRIQKEKNTASWCECCKYIINVTKKSNE